MSKLNFEGIRQSLIEEKNNLVLNKKGNVKLKTFKKDFSELFEALVFDLLSTPNNGDDFFGQFLVQISRKYNYCLNSAVNHQVVNMGVTLHINPLLLIDYTKEEMKAVLKHEIYHIINQHAKRTEPYIGAVNSKILVLACDLVVNRMADVTGRDSWTYEKLRSEFGIILAEDNCLEQNVKELSFHAKENVLFQEAIGIHDLMECIDDDSDYSDEDILCGFECDGNCEFEVEFSMLDPFFISSSNPTDLELLDDFIRNVIVEASSNSRGLMPSGVKAVLDELNAPPKISWQKILVKRLGSLPVPYKKTMVRNDRRLPDRLDLRGRISDRVPTLKVGIDTSGSVSDKEIEYILAEINAIAKIYKAKVEIIECDAEVQRTYQLGQGGKARVDIEGRGGTSFTPVMEYLLDNKVSNDTILIYFTDGGGERKIPKMPCQLLWVLTRGEELSLENPQGRILRLEDDSKFDKFRNGLLSR